ncbi:MAG: sigma-70 family RNA polymerase sigma factor [Ktedonobacteraceae bacterium]|nr:sigma-70 family RNA polymerase sigma factor [Ktedonobacteraceae bacterium]
MLKHPSLSDQSLIADLYLHYGPALLTYIRREVSAPEDAEDVLLEVFLFALESTTLRSLNERQQKSWLWSVAHNKLIDQYRRSKHRQVAQLDDVEDMLYDDDHLAPEAMILRHEAQDVLRTHVSSLPELQQQILSLRFAHGLNCSEIARLLNKNDSTIRMMFSRTLNLLRNIYKESEGEKHNG